MEDGRKARCDRPHAVVSDFGVLKTMLSANDAEIPNKMEMRRDGRVVDGGGLENH
jgi:hypothetical protein